MRGRRVRHNIPTLRGPRTRPAILHRFRFCPVRRFFASSCLLLFLLLPTAAVMAQAVSPGLFSGLKWRLIGPFRGGRVVAVAGVPGDLRTFYFGAVDGGIWKTIDAGIVWTPIFDKQPVASIGALAVAPSDPKIIYAGTGESDIREDLSSGDGVYKSVDGGENWTNLGLKNSERISKILIDPTDSETAYVCVPGKLWSDSDDRGVYKTTDGGRSWTKILKGANLSTGCSMMSMNPRDPKSIYVGMWDFRRKGWTFRSGGDNSTAASGSGRQHRIPVGCEIRGRCAEARMGVSRCERGLRNRLSGGGWAAHDQYRQHSVHGLGARNQRPRE